MRKFVIISSFLLITMFGCIFVNNLLATECHCPPGPSGFRWLCYDLCGVWRGCECASFYPFGICYGFRCEWIVCCICPDGGRDCGTASSGTYCPDCGW